MDTRDLNLDDELDDYETGFIDAILYLQGITRPDKEQFAQAMRTFGEFLAQRPVTERRARR